MELPARARVDLGVNHASGAVAGLLLTACASRTTAPGGTSPTVMAARLEPAEARPGAAPLSLEEAGPIPAPPPATPPQPAPSPVSPLVLTGRCIASAGAGQPWTLVATLANGSDTPVAMLWSADAPMVIFDSYFGLDDGELGGAGEARGVSDGFFEGSPTCEARPDVVMLPVYGHKTRRIPIAVPDTYRSHRVELEATLEIVVLPYDRPCGHVRVLHEDVQAICEPRRRAPPP